ncbi:hypothetical protein [Leptolyngbya sp. ST-U4]|uniref:hypothetical protein n=1 Tax=Leptolyngbya sp. ST-U4 TaxID=2933912 RepID=UPI0019C5672D|nr:hypothetical protein [Cyanobacteria bacterium FACHB-502]
MKCVKPGLEPQRCPDAEAHLRILQHLSPTATYRILFDVPKHHLQDVRQESDRTICKAIE